LINKFKYDGLEEKDSKDSKQYDLSKENTTKDTVKLGSFVAFSSFTSDQDYKLYKAWTLDNASDIHVCNEEGRSRFTRTQEAGPDDEIYAGKTSYPIETFGTVTLEVQTADGFGEIELTNVALAPGFMTNLVSLYLLNAK